MGEPMALNLVRAGTPLMVWNRSPQALRRLLDAGAKAANSAKELLTQVDIAILMLVDEAAMDAVLDRGGPSFAEIEFLGPMPDVEPFATRFGKPVEAKAGHWSIALTDPQKDLADLLACVEALHVPMEQLHVRRASLEDVFLQRTGRSLRD